MEQKADGNCPRNGFSQTKAQRRKLARGKEDRVNWRCFKEFKGDKMKCKCGFKFAGAGEFRNCEAFITDKGESGIVCPKCKKTYVNGKEVKIKDK